jgi:hypothetical protein
MFNYYQQSQWFVFILRPDRGVFVKHLFDIKIELNSNTLTNNKKKPEIIVQSTKQILFTCTIKKG